MTTLIRYARIDDLPSILSIYNEAIRSTTATFDLVDQSFEERQVWFQQFGERYPLLVAECGGEIAGYSCLTPFRSKPAYNRTAEVSVYLDARYRGQGIGKALLRELLKAAAERGFHVLIAAITGGNDTSVRLHTGFGFEQIGVFREVGYKFGQWQDVWFYQLTLPLNEASPSPVQQP